MSNIFDDVLKDAKSVEEEFLGPSYKYWNQINTPKQLGMSTKGSLSTLADNVAGMGAYVQLLVTGQGKASKTGGPLGDRYFLKTAATCKDISGEDVSRYIYINNVPSGKLPFISSGLGIDFTTFEGIIPGIMQNTESLNPFSLFKAFKEGSDPKCTPVQLITTPTTNNGNESKETNHMTDSDISDVDPCSFVDKKNPVTGVLCSEGFSNMNEPFQNKEEDNNLFLVFLLVIILYIIFIS